MPSSPVGFGGASDRSVSQYGSDADGSVRSTPDSHLEHDHDEEELMALPPNVSFSDDDFVRVSKPPLGLEAEERELGGSLTDEGFRAQFKESNGRLGALDKELTALLKNKTVDAERVNSARHEWNELKSMIDELKNKEYQGGPKDLDDAFNGPDGLMARHRNAGFDLQQLETRLEPESDDEE